MSRQPEAAGWAAITWRIFAFELEERLLRLSTLVYFVVFFALAFLWMNAAGGAFDRASVSFGGKVLVNAPFAVFLDVSVFALFGLFITAAVCGQAVFQDVETGIETLLFSFPIDKRQYLLGRFFAAQAVLLCIFTSVGLGFAAGSVAPWLDAARFGPGSLGAYVRPYLFMLLPNQLVFGAVFFVLALRTRKMLPVYVAAVIGVLGYLIGQALLQDIDKKTIAALSDPFGMRAFSVLTEYWTVAEKNTLSVPLAGVLLGNRLLWLALGALAFALGTRRFTLAHHAPDRGEVTAPAEQRALTTPAAVPRTGVSRLTLLLAQTRLEITQTVKNVYLLVLVLAALLATVLTALETGSMFGTPTYPVTWGVLEITGGTFSLFILIILTFYAGELVWRERTTRMELVIDALPVPDWLLFSAKLVTLALLVLALETLMFVAGIGIQLSKGYFHFELGLYAQSLLLVRYPEFLQLCALALAVHVLVNHKYVGHFVMVLFYVALSFSARLGVEHPMWKYGEGTELTYSDMNRFGPYVAPLFWFRAYWSAAAGILLLVSLLAWVRGLDSSATVRLRLAWARLTRGRALTGLVLLLAFLGSGANIYYNTRVLHRFLGEYERDAFAADYEKTYGATKDEAVPRIRKVEVKMELYPERGEFEATGSYLLENAGETPIDHLAVEAPEEVELSALTLDGSAVSETRDEKFHRVLLTFAAPLLPHESRLFRFAAKRPNRGFALDPDTTVVDNGTFMNLGMLPTLGYVEGVELSDDDARKKHGLAKKESLFPEPTAPNVGRRHVLSATSDWIDFSAVIGTSAEQIALAPGDVTSTWEADGRRYFHYVFTGGKMLDFFAFLSARYAVHHADWNGVGIDIYYHAAHPYNLARMTEGVQQGLAYCTENFGPYQSKHVRIVEFPRYATFAQSFPNTIPFSEGIGFIAKVDPDDPKDVDYPLFVSAHEVAHQWWGHQVVPAYAQGASFVVESLAEYSALMVLKRAHGDRMMGRFLRYELDRYLRGRSIERKQERPLARVENQPYIHYSKGSLALYALQDAIGEATVNAALERFLDAHKDRGPPYPTGLDLLAELKQAAPERQALVEDLFETITLYDNRALAASAKKTEQGYVVTLNTSTKRIRTDGLGAETELPVDDELDIGLLDADNKPLVLERKKVQGADHTFTLSSTALPAKAGIDPLRKRIDRKPDDNTIAVTLE